MQRGKSRDSSLTPLLSPVSRSSSQGGLRDLGNRLYEKGFNITTMPSVKRRQSHEKFENPLAVTLTSFESRKKQQTIVLKKQSTVFPNSFLKRADTTDNLLKKTARHKHAVPKRLDTPVGDRPNKPTRYLIDKFSGKFNIDKRYNEQSDERSDILQPEIQPVQQIQVVHLQNEEFPVPIRPESNLDKYIKLIQKKTMYIDEFLYLKKAEYDQRAQQNPDPYDLKVVDYEIIKAEEEESMAATTSLNASGPAPNSHIKEYFTISKKGLCHYINNKPVQFMPLTEWIAERDAYNRIKNLKFFVKFRKWKTVKMWKRNVIKHKIELCSKLLEEKLFLLNPQLRTTLLTLRANSLDMSKELTFITTRQGELNAIQESTFSLESFKSTQEKKRRECVRQISHCSKKNRQVVSEGFKQCLTALLQAQKKHADSEVFFGKKNFTVSTSNKANRRDNAYEQLGFGLKMSYEDRSELRKECSKFVRFSYLVDFVFQQALGDIYDRSVQDFIKRLEELHANADIRIQDEQSSIHRGSMVSGSSDTDSLLQIRLVPTISMQTIKESDCTYEDVQPFDFSAPNGQKKQQFSILYHMNAEPEGFPSDQLYEVPVKKRKVVPEICKRWLQLKPSCEQIVTEISHCIYEGLNSLRHFKRWSKHQQMQKYVNVLEQWDDVVSETWEVATEEYLNPSHLLETYGSDLKFQRISQLLKKSFERAQQYIRSKFSGFLTTYYQNEQVDFALFSNPNLINLSQTIEMCMRTLEEQKELFSKFIPVSTSIGMLKLDSNELKLKLVPNPTNLLDRIRSLLPELVYKRTLESKNWLIQQTSNLIQPDESIEGYIRQINHLKAIQHQFIERKKHIDNLAHLYQIMLSYKVEIKDRKIFEPETLHARDQLQLAMISAEESTNKQSDRFSKQVCQTIVPELEKSLNKLSEMVLDSKFLTMGSNEAELLVQLNRLRDKYIVLDQDKERCVVYQKTLNLPQIDFSNHNRVREEIESRIGLWEQWRLWQVMEKQWLGFKILSIQLKSIQSQTNAISKKIIQLRAFLPQNPLSDTLQQRIDSIVTNLPIVGALRCQYLKQDHWSDIKQITKLDLQHDKNLTLEQLIGLSVNQYRDAIIEIAYIAERQYQLQCKFDQVEAGWLNLTIKVGNYKGKSKTAKQTMLLHDTPEFMRALEDLVTDILAITCNKYSKSIRVKAGALKNTLINTHTYFTEWIGLQQQWRLFDTLFSSIENKRLHESSMFEQVDKTFRSLMTKALTKSKLSHVSKLMQLNAVPLEKIRQIRDTMEQVYNPINEYLNDKRKGFCRFYFVDNEQLLELINNLTPECIEKVALKCFRGLSKVNFEGDRICSLVTSEGDILKKNAVSTVGEIDQIFTSIQDIFVEGVRKLMKNSKTQEDDRRRWIGYNPSQSVLTIAKVEFTLYTEITISNKQTHPDSLNDYYSVFCKDLQGLIDDVLNGVVIQPASTGNKELAFYSSSSINRAFSPNTVHSNRQRQSKIINTTNHMAKFQLVIAQDIVHRDILEQLASSSIVNTNQFLWQKHLRFYWDDTAEESCVTVRHLLHSMKYGSDYITFEDRCIPTLSFEKLSLKVLFALTHRSNLLLKNSNTVETVASLGSTLGYNTHSYLCTQMTAETTLSQFMIGIYNSGSWGAMVNVHLLSPAILTFMAQTLEQVHTLLIKTEKRKENDFKGQFGFILTVEDSQKIPERLAGLYRTVSINQMHLQETLKIKLHYLGFESYITLAKKLAKLFQVLQVICSNDVNERKFLGCIDKIKLNEAKNTNRSFSNVQLERDSVVTTVSKWMQQTYNSSMMTEIAPTMTDLFQTQPLEREFEFVSKPSTRGSSILCSPQLQATLSKLGMTYFPGLELQLKQLQKGILNKQCVIISGESTYKSSLISLLASSQNQEIRLHHINKSIISESVLFGGREKHSNQGENCDGRSTIKGILWDILEGAASQPIKSIEKVENGNVASLRKLNTYENWMVIEGYQINECPTSYANEHMLRYLIKDRRLLYNQGRSLPLNDTFKILIECRSLRNIDPSIAVSSCIRTLQWDDSLQRAMIRQWLNLNMRNRPQTLIAAMEKYLFDNLPLLMPTSKDLTGLSDIALLNTLLTLLSTLIAEVKQPKQVKTVLAVCAVWSLFGCVSQDNRIKADMLMRKVFDGVFPNMQSVYNYYIDESACSLRQFSDRLDPGKSIPQELASSNDSYILTPKVLPLRYLANRFSNLPPKHILLVVGPQGSGKTALLKNTFYSDNVDVSNNYISFHREFTPEELQACILSKLDTYRKKQVTPFTGYDETRILIDDVWMKSSSDSSNLDLLRGLIDKKGLYCDTTWKSVVKLRLAIASRCDLKNHRISRHCLTIQTHFDEDDLVTIFSNLVAAKLPTEQLKKLSDVLTSSMLKIMWKLQKKLNSRFFSYNDVMNIINCLSNAHIKDVDQLKKYWSFSIGEAFNKVNGSFSFVQECIASQMQGKMPSTHCCLYTSIGRQNNREEEVKDVKRLMMQINERIEQYNKQNRHLPIIEYVTDETTLQHIVRLYRNIGVGNCIQFGAKNSGRSNVAKIVSWLRGYQFKVMRQGDNLLNTVVEYHQNLQKEHCTLVVPVEGSRDMMRQVVRFFSKEFYESVGAELNKEEILKNEALQKYFHENSIRNVLEFFKQQKGKNMHIVLLISDHDMLRDLMESQPHIASQFAIDYFGEWSPATFSSLAEVNLIDERLTENESKQLREAAIIASQIHVEINKHVQCSLKQYEDYIKLYVQLYRQLNGNLQSSITIYRQSYSKATEYGASLIAFTDKIDLLREECSTLSVEMNTVKQTIRQTEGEDVLLAMEKLSRLHKQTESYYDKLIEVLQKRHSDIRKTVGMLENLQEEKIKALKNTLNPSTGIAQIMELMMIILGREPEIKEIKECLTNFKDFLTEVKGISARTLNAQLVRKFREHAKKEEINNQTIKKLTFGMEFLNMLIAVKNYITEKDRSVDLNNEIRTREKQYQSIRQSYPDISTKLVEFQKKQKVLQGLLAKKSEAEKEIQDLSNKKITEEKIMQVIQDESDSWQAHYKLLEGRKSTLTTDILLMAAQFVYTAHLSIAQRKRIIESVRSSLDLPSSCTFYEHLAVDQQTCQSVTVEQLVFENMIIINNSIKTFLMIDPDKKASEWLKTYAKQIKSVNQDDPSFLSILADTITRGGHCVVEVNKDLSPVLYSLICRIDEDTPTIKLNDTELPVSDQFKLHVSVSQSIDLTQQLMDLFTVVSFEMGEETIDRQIRMEMLKKLHLQMLSKQPEIIKRRVGLKNELVNQQKALVTMFHTQFRHSEVNEKTIKEFETIKSRVTELNRNIKQQADLLTNYRMPQVITKTIKAAHIFRNAIEMFAHINGYFARWSKIPYFVSVLKQAVANEFITDEKSLLTHLFKLVAVSLSKIESQIFAAFIALRMICTSHELYKDIVLSLGNMEQLEKRLTKHKQCQGVRTQLSNNRKAWREKVIQALQQNGEQEYLTSSQSTDPIMLERLLIAVVLHEGRSLQQLYVELIRTVLGEEYLLNTSVNLTDVLKTTNRIIMSHDELVSAYEYCQRYSSSVLRIRRPEQLQNMLKKGPSHISHFFNNEKPILLVEGCSLNWFNGIFDSVDTLFKELPIVFSTPSNEKLDGFIRNDFQKIHIQAEQQDALLRRTDKLMQDGDLIDKYSGSYHWQLHYLQQLLDRHDSIYTKNQTLSFLRLKNSEQCRILTETLQSIDNLSSEVTTISKTLIREEMGYDEQLEQWQCYNYILWEVLFGQEPLERYNLAKGLLSKIAEEREYIIDKQVLMRRLCDAEMDEYLMADAKVIQRHTTHLQRMFMELLQFNSKSFDFKLLKELNLFDLGHYEQLLSKLVFTEKKTKNPTERLMLNSRRQTYQAIDYIKERLSLLSKLHFKGYSTSELKLVLDNKVPSFWPTTLSRASHRTLSTLIDRLLYQYQHLTLLPANPLTVDLSCLSSPSLYLEAHIREYSRRNNCNYEQLALAFCRVDGDRETNDVLNLVKVRLLNAQLDRKMKCLLITHQDSEIIEVELAVTQKSQNKQDAMMLTSSGNATDTVVRHPLYFKIGDTSPLLCLEIGVSHKTSCLRESYLYLLD